MTSHGSMNCLGNKQCHQVQIQEQRAKIGHFRCLLVYQHILFNIFFLFCSTWSYTATRPCVTAREMWRERKRERAWKSWLLCLVSTIKMYVLSCTQIHPSDFRANPFGTTARQWRKTRPWSGLPEFLAGSIWTNSICDCVTSYRQDPAILSSRSCAFFVFVVSIWLQISSKKERRKEKLTVRTTILSPRTVTRVIHEWVTCLCICKKNAHSMCIS